MSYPEWRDKVKREVERSFDRRQWTFDLHGSTRYYRLAVTHKTTRRHIVLAVLDKDTGDVYTVADNGRKGTLLGNVHDRGFHHQSVIPSEWR
jgi:hypothetical protein